jgi:hypothetical protein
MDGSTRDALTTETTAGPAVTARARRARPRAGTLLGPVGDAVHAHFGARVADVLLQENSEKYHDADNPLAADDRLREVFHLMRMLNEEALLDSDLGREGARGPGFRDALGSALDSVVAQLDGRPLQYVELGPEPAKTCFILRALIARGVEIASYTAVDINPASVREMHGPLCAILPESRVHHRVASFEAFRVDPLRIPGARVLLTMLGFQEGNDDPAVMSDWLAAISRPGDLLLAESQLLVPGRAALIADFYAHRHMRRFSRIAFERIFGDLPSAYEALLLPVRISDGHVAHAMILGERFTGGDGHARFLVTNYCTKFTEPDFQRYREQDGQFRVVDARYVGDRSLVFQLSERC